MNNRRHSQTVLFLTELVLVLLFFSIAASLCLQVFAKAGRETSDADRQSQCINATENVIAALRAADGDFYVLDETFRTAKGTDENSRILWIDQDGEISLSEEEDWSLIVTVTPESEGIALVEMKALKEEEEFYQFSHRLVLEAFCEEHEE